MIVRVVFNRLYNNYLPCQNDGLLIDTEPMRSFVFTNDDCNFNSFLTS